MVQALFQSWQMPQEVEDTFIRHGITTNHFKNLISNNEFLKELCPAIGTRMDLKQKINEYLEAMADTETISEVSSIELPGTSSFELIVPSDELTIPLSDIFTPKISVKDFDLKTLLETSPCGKSVLQYYSTHRTLDSKRKNRLTDIIIRHLFTVIINNRLTLDDYNIITGKIISLFPSETAGVYFTKPVRKSESGRGKSVPARGKLVDKVRNVLFQSTYRKKKEQTLNDTASAKKQDFCEILRDMHKEDIDWLENNDQPWDEVLLKWKNTQGLRHNAEYTNVQHFISKWKILRNPKATELINEDFDYLHPGKGQAFGLYWDQFFNKFIKLKEQVLLTDEGKQTLFLSLSDLEPETKIPTQLTLLANVVPPKGRTSKKSKCSTQECIESIMLFVENAGDINSKIEKQKEKAHKQKLQLQPYLILLGNLQNIRQVYLIIDDFQYTFDSVREAFDILFKCYHVLNAKYPIPSEHIHLIIQRCVYKIVTKYDNPVPYTECYRKVQSYSSVVTHTL